MSVSAIVEYRRYTVRPEGRDAFIRLFERALLEPQERAGMSVVGQFRDLDRPDRFVWLRAFPDMPSRAAALAAFYDGAVWRAHREAANAAIVDSDDVFLLRPVAAEPRFPAADGRARADAAGGIGTGYVAVGSVPFDAPPAETLVHDTIGPRVAAAGGTLVAALVSAGVPNTFPRLPVREGEYVAVWIAACCDLPTLDRIAAVDAAPLGGSGTADVLRLQPTARSALHGG